MKKIYTVLFSLISIAVFADGMHISGVIKDIQTNEAVRNASFTITFYKGVQFTGISDSLGKYDIRTNIVVPEANYAILIEAENYNTVVGFIHLKKDMVYNQKMSKRIVPDYIKAETKKEPVIVTKKELMTEVKKEPVIPAPTPVKPSLEGFATNNLVFLIDVSSSMNAPERLPLLKESLKYLVNELRSTDKVAILTFSNVAKEILPSTAAADKELILKTIDNLAFGSTSQGGAAVSIAYKTALKNYIAKGNNRVVLASDGLFTSGEKDYQKIQQTIDDGLTKNITLSIFCFGKNTEYVNSKLKKLAKTGNGNFASILNIDEAKIYMLEEAKAVKN